MALPIRDFKADSDGDLAVENGDFATISGGDAVPQGIKIRLQMFRGECYLNEDAGVPYFDNILIKNPDPLLVRALLTEAISATPDVTAVLAADLELDGETREASISYTVDTEYSTVSVSEQIEVP